MISSTNITTPFSGNLRLTVTDLVLPGNGGLTIKIMHSYNRLAERSDAFSIKQYAMGNRELNDILPASWLIGLNVPRIGFGGPAFKGDKSHGVIYIIKPDGALDRAYIQSDDKNTYLTADNWSVHFDWHKKMASILSPQGTTYSYVNAYKVYYITSVKDVHHNTLSFTYSRNPRVKLLFLEEVDANDGRKVFFRYSVRGREPRWMSICANGQKFVFTYGYVGDRVVFLNSVTRPDNTTWRYKYTNATDFDWDLQDVTNPEGGQTHYEFGIKNGKPFPAVGDTGGLQKKVTSGRSMTPGTWTYTYNSTRKGHSQTTVTGPNKKTDYIFYTQNLGGDDPHGYPVWKVGLLFYKYVYALNGALLQNSYYQYGRQRLGVQGVCIEDSHFGYHCEHTNYRPRYMYKKITRGGVTYETDYGEYTNFNQPKAFDETGDQAKKRHTDLIYFNKKNIWIVGRLKTKTVDKIPVIVNTYDTNTGDILTHSQYGVTTTYTYYHCTDPKKPEADRGDIATITDALGHTTTFDNYKRGSAQTITLPGGDDHYIRTVNNTGTIATLTDPNGNTTSYGYDLLNRTTQITYPNLSVEKITYNGAAGPGGYTITRGNYKKMVAVNGYGKPTQVTTTDMATGATVVQNTYYDAENRIRFQSYPFSSSTNNNVGIAMTYDALGRKTSVEFPTSPTAQGSNGAYQVKYNYLAHNKVQVIDPKKHNTMYTYQSYGNPNAGFLTQINQPENVTTEIQRDALGHVMSVTQGNFTRTYKYDAHYFLRYIINPETGTTMYGRDALGNMTTSQVGSSGTTNYQYDNRNRLTEVDYPNGSPSLIKKYYPNGNLKTVTKGSIQEKYYYDRNNNLKDEDIVIDGKKYNIAYGYDSLDHLKAITYPDSKSVDLTPNAFGEATQVGNFITKVTYYPNALTNTVHYQNGATTHMILNDRDLPKTIQVSGKNVHVERDYTYDGDNQIRTINDKKDPTYNLTLDYDGVNRLTSATGKWGEGSITYTPNGDIKTKTIGTQALNYQYDSSHDTLDTITGSIPYAFHYDVYGNVTNNNKHQFHYDADGNLTKVMDERGETLDTYIYDGNGHRMVTTDQHGDTTYNIYSKTGVLLYQTNPTKDWSKDNFYLAGKKIAQVTQGNPSEKLKSGAEKAQSDDPVITYFHVNLLGSPIAATDSAGELLWEQHYQPYGDRLNKQIGQNNTQWYTGKTQDNDGLLYYGARYYDPVVGRFMSMDPVGFSQKNPLSFGSYLYANDNPYQYIDPTGMLGADWQWTSAWNNSDWWFGFSTPYGFLGASQQGLDEFQDMAQGYISGLAGGAFDSLLNNQSPYFQMGSAAALLYGGELTGGDFAKALKVASKEVPKIGTKMYRVYGGDAKAFGHSWTPVNPSTVKDYRYSAGLPNSNTGQFVIEGVLKDNTGIVHRPALPIDKNLGGLPESLISNPQQQIEITRVSGVNPNF